MFRCAQCNETSKPGEGMHRIIVEERRVHYTNAAGEVVGTGWEIVNEVSICQGCKASNIAKH
jgi:hypothetical protein